MLNSDPNLIIPVLTGKELLEYWWKNILVIYLPKMGYLLAKNLKGVSDHFEIWRALKFCGALKKKLKITFWPEAPFIVKMDFQIWRNLHFFPRFKYFELCFYASVQLVPEIYSHPSCSLLELKLILMWIILLQLAVFNWSPNIYQKWNWTEDNLQIFCLK